MSNPKGNNAKSRHKKGCAANLPVSEKCQKLEAVAVQVAKTLPANWRDTDICNTDYWAARPKT